ncbi:flagellar hook-length control protein FliK [Nocardioides iriomotensis]|nr:flagellar hook-length control protein FliK [Nocardioides iriomotensis]
MPMAPMPTTVPVAADGAGVPTDAAGSGLAGETFAALMAAQLGDPAAVPAGTGTAEPGVEAEDAPATLTVTTDAETPVVPAGLVVPTAVTVPVPAPPTPATTTTTTATSTATDGDEPVEPAPGTDKVRGRSAQAPGHTGTLPERAAAPAHEHARPGGSGSPEVEHAPEPVAAMTTPAPATPASPATPPVPQTDAAQVTQLTPVAPVTAATPAAPATPATPAPASSPAAPVPNPVLDQVKPTFTRLVSGPEGTHRMMLRLHPADLGEIHLTVRVSGDTVDITVAARPEARAMLVDGHGELRGLLDSVGRTATHITFRDLPGTGTAVQVVQTGAQQGANPDGQSGAQQGGHATPDQGFAGRSGQSGGNGHSGAGAADHASSSPRDGRPGVPAETRPTTTTPRTAGHVRGALDVRM